MDDKLLAFVSMRVAEDQMRAEHEAWDWIDGRVAWVDQSVRVVAEVRRGLLEVVEVLQRHDDSEVAAQGEHILRLLASLYADHPDYLPEWCPRPQ